LGKPLKESTGRGQHTHTPRQSSALPKFHPSINDGFVCGTVGVNADQKDSKRILPNFVKLFMLVTGFSVEHWYSHLTGRSLKQVEVD
jgi:hypothetical protein